MLPSHKEQPGSVTKSSMMLRHNSYHSNGFDVARIAKVNHRSYQSNGFGVARIAKVSHNSYHSNGFDVARIASYKSELRRLSERFYVRGGASECGGGVGLRRSFLVRDLRGGVWKVQHRGNLGGLEAVRHPRSQRGAGRPVGDCQRLFHKNKVLLPPKGPLVLPDKNSSGSTLRGQAKRERQR